MAQKIIVGAHPWVYAAKQPGYDIFPILDQIFADVKAAGLDGIELMHNVFRHETAVDTIRKLSEKHSLPVLGTSFGGNFWNRDEHKAVLEDAERAIKGLAKVGGKTFGTSVGKAPAPKTPEQFDAQAELLRKIIAIGKAHCVVLNLHNHTYEVENREHDLNGTLQRIPDIKLGPDLNWCLRGGVDPEDFLRRHASNIVFLHLRDQHANGKWSESLGEGDMDHRAIARTLREINFTGEAVIELAHERDFKTTRPIRESLRMSREFVRTAMGF